jgi:hypothetical protein
MRVVCGASHAQVPTYTGGCYRCSVNCHETKNLCFIFGQHHPVVLVSQQYLLAFSCGNWRRMFIFKNSVKFVGLKTRTANL